MKDLVLDKLVLTAVPASVIDVIWSDVARVLRGSVSTANGRFDLNDIREGIKSGFYGLWVVMDEDRVVAALTTRIIVYPQCKSLAMDWVGGSRGGARMSEWLPKAHKVITKFAKENGCTQIEGYGRKGWNRWLRAYGWEPHYIAYKMEIE